MATRLRIGEAAQRLGLSQDTVRDWVRRGFIKATRTPTGQLLFDEEDVETARNGGRPAPSTMSTRLVETVVVPEPDERVPSWKRLPPWQSKVEAARASLTLDELEAERKERALLRESERRRVTAAQQREAQDNALRQRINGVKKRVIQTVWIPSQFRSEVIAEIERFATPEQLPSWLAEWEHFDLVAAHTRSLVQKLVAEEQRRAEEEQVKEQTRVNLEFEQRRKTFAAEVLKPFEARQLPRPRSVAEALRSRGVTEE